VLKRKECVGISEKTPAAPFVTLDLVSYGYITSTMERRRRGPLGRGKREKAPGKKKKEEKWRNGRDGIALR